MATAQQTPKQTAPAPTNPGAEASKPKPVVFRDFASI